jgi:Phosphatidylinositol 3- and 4-kinase.
MAEFYDASDWPEQEYYNTGGTRNKSVLQNPADESLYYFKTSLKKPGRDYKYEFWSEIIASEVGNLLGFNVLTYDIAYNGTDLGCISKLMIKLGEEVLVGGHKYLTGHDPSYDPFNPEHKTRYTFQFIREALGKYGIKNDIKNIIKIIIFDSIIGNGDRHQENWSFIEKYIKLKPKLPSGIASMLKLEVKVTVVMEMGFSPIYDSGSCLAREIADDKILPLLYDIDTAIATSRWGGPAKHSLLMALNK